MSSLWTQKIYKIEKGKRYKCSECHKKFSVTVGTKFENTKIPLSTWFATIYLAMAHKKGISSLQCMEIWNNPKDSLFGVTWDPGIHEKKSTTNAGR